MNEIALFSQFLEAAPDAMVVVDSRGLIVLANTQAERLFGFAREELLGQSIEILVPERFRGAHAVHRAGYSSHPSVRPMGAGLELQGRRKDGAEFPVEISLSPLETPDGTLVASAIRDITDRKRAEAERANLIRAEAARAQAEAAERRAALLAQGTSELSSLDIEASLPKVARRTVAAFAHWCAIYLVEGNQIRLAAYADVEPAREGEVLRAAEPLALSHDAVLTLRRMEALIFAGRSPELQRLVGPEQAGLLTARSALLVPIQSGEARIGVLAAGRRGAGPDYGWLDVAFAENLCGNIGIAMDNARLYREAQQASRMKDEFLATLSHELRTPLNAIVGWTALLQTGHLDQEKSRHGLETIARSAKAQTQLIDDILDVSRIITGRLQLRSEPLNLSTVAEAALESVRLAAEAKGVTLEPVLASDAGPVLGDPARLLQVFWNLLSNAIKFTPRGGKVKVQVWRESSHVDGVVADTGIGIPSEILPHIFERFRQGDSSSTRLYGGLGLGLAIARELVDLHGGRIEVASPGEGQGSIFRVRLPVSPIAAQMSSAQAPRPTSEGPGPLLGGLRVLVVDDHADTRHLLVTILEEHGATVISTASGEEALDEIMRHRPDVLLSDIEMPGMDGYHLIQRIRSLPGEAIRAIPAAALTAYTRGEDRLRALQEGFDLHIGKPVEPAELVAVTASLGRRR